MRDNSYYKEIFAKNLKRLLVEKNKTQSDLVDDLNLSKSTVSSWATGVRLPRMDKVDMLANYLGVTRSELIGYGYTEDDAGYVKEAPTAYYLDPETADFAQELKDRPELKMLFSASRKATKEDIEMTIDILNRLTGGQK